PISSRVIAARVFSWTALSAGVAVSVSVCYVQRGIHVRLILRDPTLFVRTPERRLCWPSPTLTARMARLRGVRRVHVRRWNRRFFDWDTTLFRLVADLRVK